jgi:FkbH-like protein
LEGILLGQGSALGEAFLSIQRYAVDLSKRGVVLAVCSKNDEANALLPFEKHPEMLLRRSHIACFVANWHDKAANLRVIAERLNLGLDSLVFLDDNPFERNQVRKELPMVSVPELPEDPALFVQCLAEAGYFEATSLTTEDLDRSQNYLANQKRDDFKNSTSDMAGYLAGLNMSLHWGAFSLLDLKRVVQLINKTNQFNLTTRRYSEEDVLEFIKNPNFLTLQFRLVDRFGDNGIIGLIIAKLGAGGVKEMHLETWLMSCRVLGRGVEKAMLYVLSEECRKRGIFHLIGEYQPTPKNGMVADHYRTLGFSQLESGGELNTLWSLDLHLKTPEAAPLFTFIPTL